MYYSNHINMKLISFLKWLILFPLLTILTYAAIGLLFSVIPSVPEEKITCESTTSIYVTSNSMHGEFVIPRKVLSRKLASQLKLRRGTKFVSFGWGDKSFYLSTPTWSELNIGTAFQALFLRGDAAMHITMYEEEVDKWKEMPLCSDQIAVVNNFLLKSFKKDDRKRLIEIPDAAYGDNDRFYEAHGNYNFMYTCNVWVTEGFKKASVKTATWSPFDFGVLYYAR